MHKPRILLVDDEPAIRLLFRTFLEKNGFEVEEAEDGETAFVKIHKFDPEVILLDILMPERTGNELVAEIKEWKPHVEIIMVTAVVSEEMKTECLSKGAFDVLNKPVDFDAMKETILAALERRGGGQS
ncbi:MAG: response regulator [Verrucomicrobia bacterium]|nr:response regulator [Verrucomicrobiota bacterium]